jgi:uncharacterized membrane protein
MNTLGMLNLLEKTMMVAPDKRNVGTTDRIVSSAAGLLLGYAGIKNFKKGGFALLLPASFLLFRGASAYCPVYNATGINTTGKEIEPFEFVKTITVHRNKEEVYNFWRKLENLPQIMSHVKRVEKVSENRYLWEAEFAGKSFEWEAEITEDVQNDRISWRSTGNADIQNSGTVEFSEGSKKKETELTVFMSYTPAKSRVGRIIARFLDPVFSQMVKDDLKKFKHTIESESKSKVTV